MLVKYKIKKEYEAEKVGIIIRGYGHVILDANNLTDEMAEISKTAGSPFFELVTPGDTATKAIAVKPIQTPVV